MRSIVCTFSMLKCVVVCAGFSEAECESQKNLLLSKMSALEEQAYQVAGHTFSLSSTEDVAQVTIHVKG